MTSESGLLAGRVALVTGVAHPRGIGWAIVTAFREHGAQVVGADLPSAEGFADSAAWPCDVADPGSVAALVDGVVAEYGGLDILVNNAGIGLGSSDFMELKAEDWSRSLEVNLMGSVHSCQHAMPHLLKRRGCIINNASIAGLGAGVGMPATYTASKFALVGLTRQLALQYAADGVRVNAVCPGPIATQLQDQAMDLLAEALAVSAAEAEQMELKNIPMGRTGEPREVADAAVYLASDLANYVTGVALPVAGGMAPGL